MAKISANHRAFYGVIQFLKSEHDSLLSTFNEKMKVFQSSHASANVAMELFPLKDKYQGIRYAIVLNVSAYVEAMINHHLSLNGVSANKLQSASLMSKWTEELTFIHPEYSLQDDDDVCVTLKTLKTERNAITHMKPAIDEKNGQTKKGSNPSVVDCELTGSEWIDKFVFLPLNLVEHMAKYIPEHKLRGIRVFSGLVQFGKGNGT